MNRIWLFFSVMFVIGTDTFLLSPLLPLLQDQFHVSTDLSGWMISAYALSYALFAFIAGPISDRLNRKTVMLYPHFYAASLPLLPPCACSVLPQALALRL